MEPSERVVKSNSNPFNKYFQEEIEKKKESNREIDLNQKRKRSNERI